ncbi:MAG: 3-hydroxyacyl-CoA dehydrogenase [Betaproteobacteria bacterium]|nr:3-hydroxyacyl-CoA dehydrogenase [Betaproteobacteria bacterium]
MIDASRKDLVLGVVGAGTMGRGITQVAAAGGIQVLLTDARTEAIAEARQFIAKMLNRAAEKGTISASQANDALGRVRAVENLQELSACHVVIEAVAEDLAVKQELFCRLETIVADDCILASNTSALPITSIAAKCKRPQRIAGTHFFNPVPLMKLVEIIGGALTDPAAGDALTILARRMTREPVRCTDFPGFLAGNIGRGFTLEAARIVEDGVAAFADVDSIMRDAVGFPMGPFQLIDNNGADIVQRAMESVYEGFYQEPYFRPSAMMRQRVTAGLLGRKSGRGFFEYQSGKLVNVKAESAVPANRPQSVWVSSAEPTCARVLTELLRSLGAKVETGAQPSTGALCLVTPIGQDATMAALAQKLDARRTVAIDALFGLGKRRTLMVTPVTSQETILEARGLLSSDGVPTTIIQDSPGFIAQRIVAMIVNIGCWIAQSGFASVEDIDKAARFGLGYPKGPFGFADDIGAQRILSILNAAHIRTGDPRYRPSPWLSRRAELHTDCARAS